jgi:hypothetical protein
MHDFVTIKVFQTKMEAEIAKSFLASNSIESYILTDDVGSMYPSTQNVSGVKLYVKKKDMQKANEMLMDY